MKPIKFLDQSYQSFLNEFEKRPGNFLNSKSYVNMIIIQEIKPIEACRSG